MATELRTAFVSSPKVSLLKPETVKVTPIKLKAVVSESQKQSSLSLTVSKRQAILSAASTGLLSLLNNNDAAFAAGASSVAVGTFLPKTEDGVFSVFTAGPKDTPALRAGNVSPYSFYIPPTWTQARIANILSGNYCQPKCAEPWIEVKFESPRQGTIQMVASPMVRLTNKLNSKIEEIGGPEKIISALGPFVTGDSYDPDEVIETNIRNDNGQTYYEYTLETPFARAGTHNLASATAKGSTVLLLVINASDSQWAENEKTLRKLLRSFSV